MNYKSLIVFFAICYAIAGIGGYATASSVKTWYPTLEKPNFTPPGQVIGQVWTVLFATIAISGWLVWSEKKEKDISSAMVLYSLQLALNLLWSFCFFYFQSPFYALLEIGILWLAILATLVAFHSIQKWAAFLLIPYILWVSFAAYLNYCIWSLNS